MNKKIQAQIRWNWHKNDNLVKKYLNSSSLILLTSEFEVFTLYNFQNYWLGFPFVIYRFFGFKELIKNYKTDLIYN